MQYDVAYDVVNDIVFFYHHHLRPLKWLACVPDDELCVSHCIPTFSHEKYMLYTVHCAAACAVRTCAALTPIHPVTINLYHFKGIIAHRTPLLHPDSPLQLICTPGPTVPRRRHHCLRGIGNAAEIPMAEKKRPVAPRSIQ